MCLFRSQRAWLATASAVLCLGVIASVVLPPSLYLTAAGDLIQSLLLFSLFVAVLTNVRASDRPTRMFWFFMSVGIGLWLSAQILWTYFEVILRKEVPNPFVGDVAFVLHLVPIVAALAIRPDREKQRSQLKSPDCVLLFSWWLYLYLFLLFPGNTYFLMHARTVSTSMCCILLGMWLRFSQQPMRGITAADCGGWCRSRSACTLRVCNRLDCRKCGD